MADAVKCDRCGALDQHRKRNVRFDCYHVETGGKDRASMGYSADLCAKCSREFLKWIGHKP